MGGLDDLIPDDADTSSSSSSSSGGGGLDEPEYAEVFESKKGTKKFTEEQWEEIKKVIRRETDYVSVGEVKSLPAQKRHVVLHELAIEALVEDADGDISRTDFRCPICGDDCTTSYVVIEGEEVHPYHTIAQLAKELGKETKSKNNEN